MINLQSILILLVAAVLIAIADAFIKQAAISGSYLAAIRTHWFYWSIALYLGQIFLVVYLFTRKWPLGILANVFVVFYSILTVLLGYLMFQEKLTVQQGVGILLGITGVFLMTK